MCVWETVWEERERETVSERERGRGGGRKKSVVERMLTGNVWQTKEPRVRPAGARLMRSSKCTLWHHRVWTQREAGGDNSEQRGGEKSKALSGGGRGGQRRAHPAAADHGLDSGCCESKFAAVLRAGRQVTQITRCGFATRLIGAAPRFPAGVSYVICFGVRM